MKKVTSVVLAAAFLLTSALVGGSAFSVNAQEGMMTTVKKGTKKVYSKSKSGVKKGYRVGHTVGGKTWNGSKWVASKSWRGGKWVAVKTVNGTKWVYRKGKGVVTGTKARRP